jgi:N-acetyl-gamma-glutamyl-phosphate reductase
LIRVSILGATGYSGAELLKILLKHKDVQIQHLTSESSADMPIEKVHPGLRGLLSKRLEKVDAKRIAQDSDLVFSCFPAGAGIKNNAHFIQAGLKVIDLSADFRLSSAQLYVTWYKLEHSAPGLLKQAVYGLPELFRAQIKTAQLIANPGCYATAGILSAAPLLKKALIDPTGLILDAKSGTSGAGKKLESRLMFSEVNDNLNAYAVASHRHQPEMEIILKKVSGKTPTLTFTPHLVPMTRGILSVLYGTLKRPMSLGDIRAVFVEAYLGEPFVRVLPLGELPETKNVTHSNYCDIGIAEDRRMNRVIVLAAIDNLVKGAAGQAVQNMNICFGLPETEGLR